VIGSSRQALISWHSGENLVKLILMEASFEDAIKRGDAEDVRRLLGRGIDVDMRDRHGQTALMLAAHAGHREVVEALIAHGANLNVTAKYGLTALMLAIIAGHANIARLLADGGTDLSLRGTGAPGFAGNTAYDLAAARGMQELLVALTPKPSQPIR
jgi:ankyrin repeat protein